MISALTIRSIVNWQYFYSEALYSERALPYLKYGKYNFKGWWVMQPCQKIYFGHNVKGFLTCVPLRSVIFIIEYSLMLRKKYFKKDCLFYAMFPVLVNWCC